jgi:hypothetical protein
MKKILLALTSLLIIGCSTTPKYKFPEDIKYSCGYQKAMAITCIQNKGTMLNTDRLEYVEVYKVKGEKKFTHGWGWRSPEWNGMWVLGLCQGFNNDKSFIIKVGVNPQNNTDVSSVALRHEFGHMWLMNNFRDHSHNSKYRDCFVNWNEVGARSIDSLEPESFYDSNQNIIIHYINDEDVHLFEVKE